MGFSGLMGLLAAAGASGGAAKGISSEAAQAVLWGIAAAGALAWLAAVWGYVRVAGAGANESEETDASGERRLVRGRVKVVRGEPRDVADGLTRALGSASWGALPVMVKREGDELLVAVPSGGPYLRAVPTFSRCAVELRAAGSGQTEVNFRMDFTDVRRRALRAARVLLCLGLILLVALPLLLYFFAAGSETPGARFQVVQAIHVGHLLWPPWLIYAIYKRGRRATEMHLDAAANNASVLAEAFAAKRAKDAAKN
jgi:hypothetical protein